MSNSVQAYMTPSLYQAYMTPSTPCLLFIKNRMILQYKVTLLVLKLLSETYFQYSFCDKLQLKESVFFYF